MYKDTTLSANFMYHLVEALKAHSDSMRLNAEKCELISDAPISSIQFYQKHNNDIAKSLHHISTELADVAMNVFNQMGVDDER